MAHVPLMPLGHPLHEVIEAHTFREHRDVLAPIEEVLAARREEVARGWGAKYEERVHSKGKLTARERIERLRDVDTRVFEFGTFVNYGITFGEGLTSPAAGVITALVRIRERWCMVIANDNTVASGSWWPRTPEKIQRAQTVALRLRLPTLYLVDCSGLFLPEQSKSFPGMTGAGHIFKMNSLLSAHGVPQLAGVFGDCIAGGGYMPIISDRVYMTEQAYMVIAGAALIKGAKSQHMTSLDIGGPEVHVHQSGCADVRVPNDEVLLDCLRCEVERLPSSAAPYYRSPMGSVPPLHPAGEISGLVPKDHREPYAIEEVVARLCDQSLFWEVLPHTGEEIFCGIGRVGGLYAGFIANRQGLLADPDKPSAHRPGGILYRAGIAKMSTFSRACNDDGIPIVWLQDISGFDIGADAERYGLLAYGSNLIYTNSTNQVPMFSVLLRKASGAGYYAMSGLPYDPVLQISTAISRLSVMEGRTLAIATYHSKLDDNFEIATANPEERKKIESGMREVESRIEQDMDPFVAARQMDTDEIIQLNELRDWLGVLIESSYQSTGYRRIKNPRIWSLHDVEALGYAESSRAKKLLDSHSLKTPEKPSLEQMEGALAFRAPSSGRFYVSPGPDKPPFVRVGDVVVTGQTVCLLEIMKTFHRVAYQGPGLPERARVVRVIPKDQDDINVNDPIIELESVVE